VSRNLTVSTNILCTCEVMSLLALPTLDPDNTAVCKTGQVRII